MDYTSIHASLDARLQTVPSLPTLQVENTRVETKGKTSWSRATLIPAKTNQETLGPNGYEVLQGLYQVDIFYPADGTYATAFAMADTILSKFVPGTELTGTKINNSYVGNPYSMAAYYVVPVIIEWSGYRTRSTIS